MRCIKVFIIVIVSCFCFNVKATKNPYKEKTSFGTNCTWYAWKMANEKAGVTLPGFGNAKDWYSDAKKAGYSVGTEAKDNSIIVWGNWTSYGHVGYVEKVEGNILYVWDSSEFCFDEEDPEYVACMDASYDEQSSRECYKVVKDIACKYTINPDEYGITGYIYLNEAPKKTNTNTNKIDKPKEEVIKSSNAYLKNIVLNEEIIDVKKDNFEYSLDVSNEYDKIKIDATLEDSKSTLSGVGEYELNVGINEISLSVTAEDKKTNNEYIIKITRKEKIKEEDNLKNVVEKQDKKENKKYDVIIILVAILSLISSLFLINKKHK